MPEQQPNQPITITYPSGEVVSKIVDIIVRKRPNGWSRRSYAAYYKESWGEWMKGILDDIIERRVSKFLPYANFPKMKRNSVYLLVNQSMKFVLEQMDSDGRYRKITDRLSIDRSRKEGIQFILHEVAQDEGKVEDLVPHKEMPKWLERMNNWLEDDTQKQPFIQSNLMLTKEEVEQVKLELSGLTNIMASVSMREIKIIKTS